MSKKTLLSALLISALSFSSTVFGVADVSEKGTELNGAAFRNCKFSQFPLVSSAKDSLAAISFQGCTLETFDPTFLTYNPRLNKLCLAGCTTDLSIFAGGKFGLGCTSLAFLNLKGIPNFSFEDFLSIAAPDLLDRILTEKCKLRFCRADSGQTLAIFRNDSKSDELSFEEIKRYIRMYRTAQAAASRSSVDQSALTSSLGLWGTVLSLFGSASAAQ